MNGWNVQGVRENGFKMFDDHSCSLIITLSGQATILTSRVHSGMT